MRGWGSRATPLPPPPGLKEGQWLKHNTPRGDLKDHAPQLSNSKFYANAAKNGECIYTQLPYLAKTNRREKQARRPVSESTLRKQRCELDSSHREKLTQHSG